MRRAWLSVAVLPAFLGCASVLGDFETGDDGTLADAGTTDSGAKDSNAPIDATPDRGTVIDATPEAAADATPETGADSGCAADHILCSGTCVPSDATNCGVCGNACVGGLTCVGGVCGGPTTVRAVASAGVKIGVSWNPPATGGLPITNYVVTSTPGSLTQTTATPSASFTTGLTIGTSYTFSVVPQTSAGAAGSGVSNAAVAGDVPGIPPTVAGRPAAAGSVAVTWGAAAANGYPILNYVAKSNPGAASATTSALNATLGGLASGSYTFEVYATNALGQGPIGRSAPVSLCANITRTLIGVDKVDVNYAATGGTYTDNMVRAYMNSPTDITGWIKFDLRAAGVPATATVVSMTFSLNAVNSFGSPSGVPNVALSYCNQHTWARASATTATMPRVQQLTAGFGSPVLGFNNYAVPAGARDFTADVQAGVLTLGVSNINAAYSYAYYDGVDAANKPTLTLTTCE